MKKHLFILLLEFCFQTLLYCQSHSDAEITFEEIEHNFGNINKDDSIITFGSLNYEFKFKNTGNEPLVIYSAESSCGCHCGHGPVNAIMPGKTGVIHYSYYAKRIGMISGHHLFVQSNAKTSVVRLKGSGYICD